MSAGSYDQREDLYAPGGFQPGYHAAVPPTGDEIAARQRADWERLRVLALSRGVVLVDLETEGGGHQYVAMLGEERLIFDSAEAVEEWLILSSQSHGKYFATLQARAALKGIQLVESHMECGGVELILSWNALTRAFGTLAEVDAWLTRVEGRPA